MGMGERENICMLNGTIASVEDIGYLRENDEVELLRKDAYGAGGDAAGKEVGEGGAEVELDAEGLSDSNCNGHHYPGGILPRILIHCLFSLSRQETPF